MSTLFRVVGRGSRLTLPRARLIARRLDGSIEMNPPPERSPTCRLVCLPNGYLHLYKTGKHAWNVFERFGGNGEAAETWQDALAQAGIETIDEHEEGFDR